MKHFSLSLVLSCFLLPSFAAEIAALTIRDGNVSAYSVSGAYRGSLCSSGDAIDAQTDGNIVAVLHRDGVVSLYNAAGAYRGSLNVMGAVRLQVVSGLIIIHKRDGSATLYSLNGAYRGSL